MTVISYPIPPYSNLPINAQFYQPSRFVISGITLGVTTTVTTASDNNYVVGQLVRLIIPPSFGTRQLNEQEGYVLSIPTPNQVVININSVGFDPFINSFATSKAQILPIGDIGNGVVNTNGRTQNITYIPGSFINISPI
jgi:hypothetical protein